MVRVRGYPSQLLFHSAEIMSVYGELDLMYISSGGMNVLPEVKFS